MVSHRKAHRDCRDGCEAFNRGAHPTAHWRATTAEDFGRIKHHLIKKHGVYFGRPKPRRNLLEAGDIGDLHKGLHDA